MDTTTTTAQIAAEYGVDPDAYPCPDCKGTGLRVDNTACMPCYGTGTNEAPLRLAIIRAAITRMDPNKTEPWSSALGAVRVLQEHVDHLDELRLIQRAEVMLENAELLRRTGEQRAAWLLEEQLRAEHTDPGPQVSPDQGHCPPTLRFPCGHCAHDLCLDCSRCCTCTCSTPTGP